jgi:hypothetical protein
LGEPAARFECRETFESRRDLALLDVHGWL